MSYRIYNEDAAWFELLTRPQDYIEEAEIYRRAMVDGALGPVRDVVELGAGGGNNAVHLKRHFAMTLVDLSPAMIALARARSPECEHACGDMRSVRLGRVFDGVLIHDAITYMTTRAELRAALETAFVHCRPGGVAIFVPKYTRETFAPATRHGGSDGPDGRSMRYLHWCTKPNPEDTTYTVLLTWVLREPDGRTRVESEEHINGVFTRRTWHDLLTEVGFAAVTIRNLDRACLVSACRPLENS